jgi:superoxide dismutase, Cu-Zn family
MKATTRKVMTIGLAGGCWLAAIACNRDTRGDKVNEASVTPAGEPTSETASGATATMSEPMRASADLIAAGGAAIDGHAKFFQQPKGVLVVVEVKGASPGKKGVHVHTKGDCSDIAGQSMGSHFAPKLEQHALPSEPTDHHLGDLGNIEVAADGTGRLEIEVPSATLGADDSTSFLGRALIVHSGEDTGSGAQPAGNSGNPIACGVIHENGA